MKVLLIAFKPETQPDVLVDKTTGAVTVVGVAAKIYEGDVPSMEEFDEIVARSQK